MSKLIKGIVGGYSLLRPMGDKRGTHVYNKHQSLYAWYQFSQDISDNDGPLLDLSNNSFGLIPSSSGDRPGAPASISSMSDAPSSGFPSGWPTKKTNFSNDLILHADAAGENELDFSFGNGVSDSAFSVSIWMQADAIPSANMDLVTKWSELVDAREWRINIKAGSSQGQVRFSLYDESTNDQVNRDSRRILTAGRWFHIVCTYNGCGGPEASLGMKVYIDGEEDSIDGYHTYGFDSSYTAMENTESAFAIGNQSYEQSARDYNGNFGEVAVWSTVLDASDVKALYQARYGVTKFGSGIISNPTRVLLREHDQVDGRYPLNAKTAPATKKYDYEPFNDRNTFVFTSPFAAASVTVTDVPYNADWLDLTSSSGAAKQRFIFFTDEFSSRSWSATANNTIHSTWEPILLNKGTDRKTETAQQAASLLADAIHGKEKLFISTFYEPEVVEKLFNQVDDADHLGSYVRPDPIIRPRIRLEYLTASSTTHYSASHGGDARVGNAYISVLRPKLEVTQFRINQSAGSAIRYPSLLGADRLKLDGTATGHASPDMVTKAREIPGITDLNYKPKTSNHHTPYDDSRIPYYAESSFFNEGTSENVLPGFTNPLRSKTQIVLELSSSNDRGTRIFFHSGTLAESDFSPIKAAVSNIPTSLQSTSGSGFAYWSPDKQRWEMTQRSKFPHEAIPASGTTNNYNMDIGGMLYNPFDWSGAYARGRARQLGMLGFALQRSGTYDGDLLAQHTSEGSSGLTAHPPDYFSATQAHHNLKMVRALDGYYTPVIQWRFPLGDQYNATSSQVYNMSKYISSPFLLEKMNVEFEGNLGLHSDLTANSLPLTKVLFILNQTTNPDNPSLNYEIDSPGTWVSGSTSSTGAAASYGTAAADAQPPQLKNIVDNRHPTHTRREIISWAKIGLIRDDNKVLTENYTGTDTLISYEAETLLKDEVYEKIVTFTAAEQGKYGVTGSFSFQLYPKLPLRNDGVSFTHVMTQSLTTTGNPALTGLTGPDMMGTPVKCSNPYGGAALDGKPSGRHMAESLTCVQPHSTGSFIYDPVLGYIYAKQRHYDISPYLLFPTDNLIIGWQNLTPLGTCHNHQANGQNVDRITNVKITLFGSSVRDSKEFHNNLEQNLTTNEIHEVIYGDPVVDQFDVEPIISLSGSTHDAMINGIMKTGYEDPDGRARLHILAAGGPSNAQAITLKSANGVSITYTAHASYTPLANPRTAAIQYFSTAGADAATIHGRLKDAIRGNTLENSDGIMAASGTHDFTIESDGTTSGNPYFVVRNVKHTPDGNTTVTHNLATYTATGLSSPSKADLEETNLFAGGAHTFRNEAVRGRIGSIAAGHAGSTGSLTRNIGITTQHSIYEDSLAPPISFFLSLPYFFSGDDLIESHGQVQPGIAGLAYDKDSSIYRVPSLVLSQNPASRSFDLMTQLGVHNLKNFIQNKVLSPASNYLETAGGGPMTQGQRLIIDTQAYRSTITPTTASAYSVFSGTVAYAGGVASHGANSSTSAVPAFSSTPTLLENQQIKFAISSLFLAAPTTVGAKRTLPILRFDGENGSLGVVLSVHGYKYGFMGITPMKPKTYFRRNSYGQFRDLIEQTPETSTQQLIAQIGIPGGDFEIAQEIIGWPHNDGPVKSRFFTRSGEPDVDPLNTNAQNLSPFATSSMPYIDGHNVDRDVVNHPPPDMTDKTSISEVTSVDIDPPE